MIERNCIKWIYREDLYHIKEVEIIPTPPIGQPYFGENKKHITIFIESTALDFYKTEDFLFLTQVMEAVFLTPNEYVIINLSAYTPTSWSSIQEKFSPNTVIAFTEKSKKFYPYLNVTKYTPTLIENINYLIADPLSLIQKDKSLKKIFGIALKRSSVSKLYSH